MRAICAPGDSPTHFPLNRPGNMAGLLPMISAEGQFPDVVAHSLYRP
jgi:hypothetical protein